MKIIVISSRAYNELVGRIEKIEAAIASLPEAAHRPSPNDNPMSPYRHLVINGEEFDFTNGFTDLHTLSYERILAGRGFAVEDTACAVHTLDMLRKSAAVGLTGDYHPLLRNLQG